MAKKTFEVALLLTAKDEATRIIAAAAARQRQIMAMSERGDRAFAAGRTAGAIGIGIGAALALPLKAAADMETLNTALQSSFRGNATAAKEAFEDINKFAAKTPFSLDEVMTSFIKLKNSGLDPSTKALEAYGNIASSLPGKTLNDFTEAVTDAVMGENERLKEFNISASKSGDMINYTFAGVTTSVRNNAKEIQQYLQYIGNVKFAGATLAQSKTFNGMMSTLTDNVRMAASELGDNMLPQMKEYAQSITDNVSKVSTWIQENKDLIGIVLKVTAGLAALSIAISIGSFLFGGLFKVYAGILWAKKTYIFLSNLQIWGQIKLNAVVWYTVAAENAATAAQWLFNASLYGCPVVWIVAGVMAIIAVVWLLVKYWKPITAFFVNLWASIKAVFSSSVSWFKNIGSDIITGLWNGIKAKATALFDFVKGIGKGIANAFKTVLGIASPSKVFMDYGVNITEGAHNGIKKGESKLVGASKGMGSSIKPTASGRGGGGGSSVTVNFAPVINGGSGDVATQVKALIPELIRQIESQMQRKQRLAY